MVQALPIPLIQSSDGVMASPGMRMSPWTAQGTWSVFWTSDAWSAGSFWRCWFDEWADQKSRHATTRNGRATTTPMIMGLFLRLFVGVRGVEYMPACAGIPLGAPGRAVEPSDSPHGPAPPVAGRP